MNRPQAGADAGKKVDFKLTGIKKESSVDVYVSNVKRRRGQNLQDIAEMVRSYCQKNGVRVMYARTIRNRYCEDSVGYKLTVPMRQYDDVIADRFWPDEVSCRKLEQKGSNTEARTDFRGADRQSRSRVRDNRDGRDQSRSRNREDYQNGNRYGGNGGNKGNARPASRSVSRRRNDNRTRSTSQRRPASRSRSRSRSPSRNRQNHGQSQNKGGYENSSDYWWGRDNDEDDRYYDASHERQF